MIWGWVPCNNLVGIPKNFYKIIGLDSVDMIRIRPCLSAYGLGTHWFHVSAFNRVFRTGFQILLIIRTQRYIANFLIHDYFKTRTKQEIIVYTTTNGLK